MIPKPNDRKAREQTDPEMLLIVSHPKVGKTHALLQLPNSLLIDLGRSGKKFGGVYVDVYEEATKQKKNPIAIVKNTAAEIKAANIERGDFVYDYIIIDTITELESKLALEYAKLRYKKSAVGKDSKITDILAELEYGGGYQWLRASFNELLDPFKTLAKHTLILVGHTKMSSIKKDGKDISVRDLDLTGKIKTFIALEASDIGYLYRGTDGITNYLSFINKGDDINVGARTAHLSNQEFALSQKEGDNLKVNWKQIFKTLNNKS